LDKIEAYERISSSSDEKKKDSKNKKYTKTSQSGKVSKYTIESKKFLIFQMKILNLNNKIYFINKLIL